MLYWFKVSKKYKEFAQVKLADALHRGTVYDFEMHVRLAFWSNASLKSFGALFSKGGYTNKKEATKTGIIDSVCKNMRKLLKGQLDRNNPSTSVVNHLITALEPFPILNNIAATSSLSVLC